MENFTKPLLVICIFILIIDIYILRFWQRDNKKTSNNKLLFSWEDVPGKDSTKLKEFLIDNYEIRWVERAQIKKIDNRGTIKVFTENKSLSLRLNDKKFEFGLFLVNLQIDGVRTDVFIAKTENDKQNIYKTQLSSIIETLIQKQLPFFCKPTWHITKKKAYLKANKNVNKFVKNLRTQLDIKFPPTADYELKIIQEVSKSIQAYKEEPLALSFFLAGASIAFLTTSINLLLGQKNDIKIIGLFLALFILSFILSYIIYIRRHEAYHTCHLINLGCIEAIKQKRR